MATKDLKAAIRAPFSRFFGGTNQIQDEFEYAFDNAYVMKWRNAADIADVEVLTVTSGNVITLPGAITLSGAVTASSTLALSGVLSPNAGMNFAALVPAANVYGSVISTGTTWVAHSTPGAAGIKLLLANTAATGNFATARFRARSDVATATWNTNTIACDLSASANIADYGELISASCYVQDNGYNQARADHWTTGVKICTLCTGTSAGTRWGLHVTDYSTTKASSAHYLARFDKPTGSQAIDGVFKMGNCDQFTYLFNFEVSGGYLTNTDTRLQVMTPAGAKYIALT